MSYCNGTTVAEARDNAQFVEVTANTVWRNGAHGTE